MRLRQANARVPSVVHVVYRIDTGRPLIVLEGFDLCEIVYIGFCGANNGLKLLIILVGKRGFEPPTFMVGSQIARLSYQRNSLEGPSAWDQGVG
jgi:hypothetical protein